MSLMWVRVDESFKRGSNFIRQRVKLHRRLKARSPGLAPAVGVRFEALISRSSASRAFIVTAPRTARRQHSARDRSAPSHDTLAHPRTPRDHVRVGRSHGLGQPGATRAAPIARSLPAPHPSPAAPALRRAAADDRRLGNARARRRRRAVAPARRAGATIDRGGRRARDAVDVYARRRARDGRARRPRRRRRFATARETSPTF